MLVAASTEVTVGAIAVMITACSGALIAFVRYPFEKRKSDQDVSSSATSEAITSLREALQRDEQENKRLREALTDLEDRFRAVEKERNQLLDEMELLREWIKVHNLVPPSRWFSQPPPA